VNNVTSQRARVGREVAVTAGSYWNELLIFLQNALIRIAGTRDVLRMTGKQITNFATRFFRQYCARTGDLVALLAAGPQAGGVARQQPHHLDRDEEGE